MDNVNKTKVKLNVQYNTTDLEIKPILLNMQFKSKFEKNVEIFIYALMLFCFELLFCYALNFILMLYWIGFIFILKIIFTFGFLIFSFIVNIIILKIIIKDCINERCK